MEKPFEIRNGPRRILRCSFIYNGDGMMGEGTLWDLSLSGWRATGNSQVTPGTEMSVYLALPDRGESKYVAIDSAIVRWSEGNEAGWEIIKMDAGSRARIKAFLEQAEDTEMPARPRFSTAA